MASETEQACVSCRSLDVSFPRPINQGHPPSLLTSGEAPVITHAVQYKRVPTGADWARQVWYTGMTNSWPTEAYKTWLHYYQQREEENLPKAYAQHLREAYCQDPTMPAQYLHSDTRWGAFQWRDKLVPGKEFVVDRHKTSNH
ncbi:uncharacterized protein C19orf71 homolog [Protopterus annectens]|uniref:uncharacterized protein C19orf71 homolog n=1 Tax=Protopterus annectens TaxID=7888 RepID=UPI001CF99793|nr:uncharacterized protein C19orf71 homolog [Protopterus annectens]